MSSGTSSTATTSAVVLTSTAVTASSLSSSCTVLSALSPSMSAHVSSSVLSSSLSSTMSSTPSILSAVPPISSSISSRVPSLSSLPSSSSSTLTAIPSSISSASYSLDAIEKTKNNYTRLSRLLIDIGRCVLQDVFDSIHPPSTLNTVLNSPSIHRQLLQLKTKKILYRQQWNKLYPSMGVASSTNFDITLLFVLLRNICSVSPPATGWDRQPPPSDQSREADLVRIKLCLNELYAHKVDLALSDTDFEGHWNEIQGALIRLGGLNYESEIQQLSVAPLDVEWKNAFDALSQSWEEGEDRILGEIQSIVEQNRASDVEIKVQGIVKVLTVGGVVLPWALGSYYILRRYYDDPDMLIRLVQEAIIPSGIVTGVTVTAILKGSFIIVVAVSSLEALHLFWNSYKDGEMEKKLEKVLVTRNLKSCSPEDAEKIIISIKICGEEYEKALECFTKTKRPKNYLPRMPSINAKKKLLTERLPYFKDDINPKVILDSLNCLIEEDKQVVESDQNNYGAISATRILIDRLRRRDKGYEQFVVALRDRGLDQVALLLDPYETVDPNDANAAVEKDYEKFTIIGTAVDVVVSFQIMLDNERKVDFEEVVANEYSLSRDEKSCKIRKEFKKREMPKGVAFVRTKPDKPSKKKPKNTKEATSDDKDDSSDDILATDDSTCAEEDDNDAKSWEDSFQVVFRLTSGEVAKKFWAMYESKELATKIADVLVESTLLRLELLDSVGKLTVNLNINEEDYKKIMEFFEDKKSEQDVEMTGERLLISRGPGNEGPDALDEIDIKIPEVLLESNKAPVQKRNLKLREYQKELSQPAIEGRNTIICAPTNSGKTFVAMEIARLHLEKYNKNENEEALDAATTDTPKQKPKIIFIVSTQNLVLQQRQRFEEYLVNYSITDISGTNSTEIPLDFLLKTHDVIILTAQILLNALQKSSVNISQITLLVFDECHHTNKDHTYNKIMQHYMTLKWDPDPDRSKMLPQIVGLTASLGVGRANETEKAKNHILQICANMDAWCVSTVRENIEELERNVTGGVPKRRLEKVDQQPNVFEKVIVQIMDKIETAAQRYSTSRPPADRVSQQYRQWVEGLEKEAISKGLRDLSTFAKHLRRYHIALVINDTVRIKDALRYLQEYFDRLDRSKFQPSDKKLQELYEKATQGILSRIEKAEPENPKLVKLKELILKFHEEDKGKDRCGETKGILFTKTRDSTKGIMGWIEETLELKAILRPKVLVGAGDGEVGMTQGEQEAIIEEFKKSEVNILIATTVAEEGLDIGDCNFVIRYNMAGNEISSVQARGRIRADEGNYVYVGTSRDKGVNRERLNQYRESLMTLAVDEVQMIPHPIYMDKIKEIQQKDVRKYQMKNFLISKKVKANGPMVDDIIFYCRRCNTKACHLNEFRRLKDNYHVILEKKFKHRIHVKPKRVSKKIDDVLMDSQVHCKECDEDWGVTVKIDGFTWPCLKIRSFAVELPKGKRTTFKKWSDFHFEIPEATVSEIIERDDTLDTDDLDLDV